MMPMPPQGQGPMQGLAAAQPEMSAPEQPQASPEAAMGIIQDAVAQFGPEIVSILKQILASAPDGGAEEASEPPMM